MNNDDLQRKASRTPRRLHLRTMLALRCPECGEGAMFASTWKMHERCPQCGITFERGPGYYTGAMYFSYMFGIPLYGGIVLVGWLLFRSIKLHWILLASWLAFIPFAAPIFRYSRVLFTHFDHYIDPEESGGSGLR